MTRIAYMQMYMYVRVYGKTCIVCQVNLTTCCVGCYLILDGRRQAKSAVECVIRQLVLDKKTKLVRSCEDVPVFPRLDEAYLFLLLSLRVEIRDAQLRPSQRPGLWGKHFSYFAPHQRKLFQNNPKHYVILIK